MVAEGDQQDGGDLPARDKYSSVEAADKSSRETPLAAEDVGRQAAPVDDVWLLAAPEADDVWTLAALAADDVWILQISPAGEDVCLLEVAPSGGDRWLLLVSSERTLAVMISTILAPDSTLPPTPSCQSELENKLGGCFLPL